MTAQITGLHHILLVTRQFDKTVDLLVNVLGLKVKGTTRRTMNAYPAGEEARSQVPVDRLYFLQMPDKAMIVVAEVPDGETPEIRPSLPAYWPDMTYEKPQMGKVDHLALNVASRADLLHFQQLLREHGYSVSEINERKGSPKFVKSIYFHSPDGLPMEICTWDFNDPEWAGVKDEDYYRDPDPVPSVRHLVPAASKDGA